jgi:hypothetical protein
MTSVAAFALVVSLTAPATSAQKPIDPDLKEMSTYLLTMETLNKVDRAMRSVIVELKKDPRFQESERLEAELEKLRAKEEPTEADEKRIEAIEQRQEELEKTANPVNWNNAKTLNEMAAAVQKFPPLMNALQREGLSAREFSKFMLGMIQAGFAAGMQKAGLLKTTPEGTNPANIKWVLEHEAELQKMQAAWGPEKKK